MSINNNMKGDQQFTLFPKLPSDLQYEVLRMASQPIAPKEFDFSHGDRGVNGEFEADFSEINEIFHQMDVYPAYDYFSSADRSSIEGKVWRHACSKIAGDPVNNDMDRYKLTKLASKILFSFVNPEERNRNIQKWGVYSVHVDRIKEIKQKIYDDAFMKMVNAMFEQGVLGDDISIFEDFTIEEIREWLRDEENVRDIDQLSLTGKQFLVLPPEISYLTSLTYLEVSNTLISDVSPLARLENLMELHLERNRINKIDSLAELRNLTGLFLDDNYVQDLSPLEGSPNLVELRVKNNRLQNIGNLDTLPHLSILDFSNNRLTDENVASLSNLQRIRFLKLNGNQIRNINFVLNGGYDELSALHLANNQVQNLSGLARLPMLRALDLSGNGLTDIQAAHLSELQAVENLKLNNNNITDIHFVLREENGQRVGLQNLVSLNLENNHVQFLRPLTLLPNLHKLSLRNNSLETEHVVCLSFLQTIEELDLSENRGIREVGFLRGENPENPGLLTLTSLNLENCSVFDISPISLLQNLRVLNFNNNDLGNVNNLEILPQLEIISLEGNGILSTNFISNFPALEVLNLSDNPIRNDLSSLSSIKATLTELYLNNCSISDISDIKELDNLEILILNNNQISSVTPLESLVNLSTLNLNENPLAESPQEISEITGLTHYGRGRFSS